MKDFRSMTVDQVIDLFLEERGLPSDHPDREKYPPELIRRFQRGDHAALIEILKTFPRTSPGRRGIVD